MDKKEMSSLIKSGEKKRVVIVRSGDMFEYGLSDLVVGMEGILTMDAVNQTQTKGFFVKLDETWEKCKSWFFPIESIETVKL